MNNNSFLDELNQISKTKEELEQEKIEKMNKKDIEDCKTYANLFFSKIIDTIKYKAQSGEFVIENNKRKIYFDAYMTEDTYLDYSTARDIPIRLFRNESKWKEPFFEKPYHLYKFYWDEKLINMVNDYLAEFTSKQGIICSPIKIKYEKRFYKEKKEAFGKSRILIDTQTRVYDIPNNKEFIEYAIAHDEGCYLFVEGYIEY